MKIEKQRTVWLITLALRISGAPRDHYIRFDANDYSVRKVFRRDISRPQHFVPTAEGFGAAVPAGLGWGMFPDSLAAPAIKDGAFVRVADSQLEVPLYWQCWTLDSPIVARITDAVRSAATDGLHKSLGRLRSRRIGE